MPRKSQIPQQAGPTETGAEVFPDGTLIELVRDHEKPEQLRLLAWNGTEARVEARIDCDGRLYQPIAVHEELLQAIRLPENSIVCSSTKELFDRLKREILARAKLQEGAACLTTCFLFANWVADRLPFLPPLAISGPRDAAHALLRTLGWMCRRPLAVSVLESGSLPRAASRLNPTVLIYEPELSKRALHFLRGTCVPGTTAVANGVLKQGFCPKVIYAGESYTAGMFGRAIHIVVSPMLDERPWPTPSEERALSAELQARLLGYRLRSCQQIVVRHLDAACLGSDSRRLAEVLASAVDDQDVVAAMPDWFAGQEDWRQGEALVDIQTVVIEATLALVHRGGSELQIGEICQGANAILHNRGEKTFECLPREVGGVLRAVGLEGKRRAAGFVIRLSDAVSRKVHGLARAQRIPPCDGPACSFCGLQLDPVESPACT